jgi:ankyrin repeat protein
MELFNACKNGNLEVVRKCVEGGADVNQPNESEKYFKLPIEIAAVLLHNDVVKYLLQHGAKCTDITLTAVNNYEIENLLIEGGADINAKGDCGSTLLHVACDEEPDFERVKYLVEHGANVNVVDEFDCTPLYLAAYDQPDIVAYLLAHGADPHFPRQCDGETPIERAKRILSSVSEPDNDVQQVVNILSAY